MPPRCVYEAANKWSDNPSKRLQRLRRSTHTTLFVPSNYFREETSQCVFNEAPGSCEEYNTDKQENWCGKKRDGAKHKVADADQHEGYETEPDVSQPCKEPAHQYTLDENVYCAEYGDHETGLCCIEAKTVLHQDRDRRLQHAHRESVQEPGQQ